MLDGIQTGLTDEELAEATRKAAENLSFYNAAEGDCWRQETQARGKARAEFVALRDRCEKRGVVWNPDNVAYLV